VPSQLRSVLSRTCRPTAAVRDERQKIAQFFNHLGCRRCARRSLAAIWYLSNTLEPFSKTPRTPREHTVTRNGHTIQASRTLQRKDWTPLSALSHKTPFHPSPQKQIGTPAQLREPTRTLLLYSRQVTRSPRKTPEGAKREEGGENAVIFLWGRRATGAPLSP